MTQLELERELARHTGDSLSTIRRHGFGLVESPELEPLAVDWDQLDAERVRMLPVNRGRSPAA
jgi:hypothetical protein